MTPTTASPALVGTGGHATIPIREVGILPARTAIRIRDATPTVETAIPVPAGADSALVAVLDRRGAASALQAVVLVLPAALVVDSGLPVDHAAATIQ
ncbi:MAG: hypothetical protein M3552_00015, partial [Planctomycetota bacterium]|nr:hypothetical protein [Planctomycetota bacterium]